MKIEGHEQAFGKLAAQWDDEKVSEMQKQMAGSKWELGVSDPSTSNLIALAKLFGTTPEELLKEVER